MADNGSAGNLFNDRRGTNPFQPVTPAPVRFSARPMAPQLSGPGGYGGDSYLGHGTRLSNGMLAPTQFNGKVYTRNNPDLVDLRRQQISIGERTD